MDSPINHHNAQTNDAQPALYAKFLMYYILKLFNSTKSMFLQCHMILTVLVLDQMHSRDACLISHLPHVWLGDEEQVDVHARNSHSLQVQIALVFDNL